MAASKKDALASGLLDVLGSFANNSPEPAQVKKESPKTVKEEKKADSLATKTTKAEKSDAAKAGEGSAPAARRLWSFRIKEEAYEKITAISYWDRKNIQAVMDEILDEAIAEYEKKNGKIQPVKK